MPRTATEIKAMVVPVKTKLLIHKLIENIGGLSRLQKNVEQRGASWLNHCKEKTRGVQKAQTAFCWFVGFVQNRNEPL